MFENFSFSSPSSSRPPRLAVDGDDRTMMDCDSCLISPMSSRCPSPRSSSTSRFPRTVPRSRSLYFRSPQPPPPTSVPFSDYDHRKRLSIGTLTRKLHEHTIQQDNASRPASPTTAAQTPRSSSSSSRFFHGYVLTPPNTDHDDEFYSDSLASLPVSPSLSPQPQSPFLNPTSVPSDLPDLALQPDAPLDASSVRSRRQHISRLQYTSSDLDTIRRTLLADADETMLRIDTSFLAEDCHPSSLPPQQGPRRRRTISLQRSRVRSPVSPDTAGGPVLRDPLLRRKSTCGTGSLSHPHSHRIEKSYQHSSEYRNRGEQGLRRKSLVSAALTSMIERGE